MNLYKIYGMDQDGKVHERHIVAQDHEAACRAWREFGPKDANPPQPVSITETQEIGKSLIFAPDLGNRPGVSPSNFDLSPDVKIVGRFDKIMESELKGHRYKEALNDSSVEIDLDASGNPVYIPRENK